MDDQASATTALNSAPPPTLDHAYIYRYAFATCTIWLQTKNHSTLRQRKLLSRVANSVEAEYHALHEHPNYDCRAGSLAEQTQIEVWEECGDERSLRLLSLRDQIIAIRDLRREPLRELHQHIEPYAAHECLRLCGDIQQKLPRELRDLVYEHLLADLEGFRIDNGHGNSYTDERCEHTGRSAKIYDYWKCGYHVIESDYVGAVTKKEIGEAWYRTCTLEIYSRNRWDLNEFLQYDIWRFGLRPVDFFRHLEVAWCSEHEIKESGPDVQEYLLKLQPLVESLLLLSTRPKVTFEFSFPWDKVMVLFHVMPFVRLVSALFPIFATLLDADFPLELQLDREKPGIFALGLTDLTVHRLGEKLFSGFPELS
jgi:hypothetical protein